MFQRTGFLQRQDVTGSNGDSPVPAPQAKVCLAGDDVALVREFFELLAEWEEKDSGT